jgi:two-component system nitrogen regulation response regulator GlnG/two-component system response regulator HydG
MALVVVWCSQEAERVGEVVILPAGAPSEARVLGRGTAALGDGMARLDFARHRPAKVKLSPPLGISSISRSQLVIRAHGDDLIEVKNVGRAELLHNGAVVSACRVAPGDTLQLGRQLLLLCVSRPAWLPGGPDVPLHHTFGEVDDDGFAGESPKMWELRRTLIFGANCSNHILLHGATGTGKELAARAIHQRSALHAKGRFVSRNAATIPSTLIDAELFGNEKNYPNPGMADRPGLIGEADGGTLFLDEFTEMGRAGEGHLLRVLDQGEYQRLGEARIRKSNFRLIAATNRPPSALKHDLLARLVLRIETPDLNERREDIPLLARHLLRQMLADDPTIARFFDPNDAGRIPRISIDFMQTLVTFNYTANVRELHALLLESVRTSDGDELLPFPLRPSEKLPTPPSQSPNGPPKIDEQEISAPDDCAQEGRATLTPQRVQAVLDQNNGALESTWRMLGLPSRHALRRFIQKHGLEIRRRSVRR